MLVRYRLIGRSLTLFKGRVSVLGVFVLVFSILAWKTAVFVISSEWTGLSRQPFWLKTLTVLGLAVATGKIANRFLFRPLPPERFPADAEDLPQANLRVRLTAGRPFRECDGFGRQSVFQAPPPQQETRHE